MIKPELSLKFKWDGWYVSTIVGNIKTEKNNFFGLYVNWLGVRLVMGWNVQSHD